MTSLSTSIVSYVIVTVIANSYVILQRSLESWVGIQNTMGCVSIADRKIEELWFLYDRTIPIDRRRSQKCVLTFHMIADDRRTFYDLRSAIVCDHMETSLK